MVRGCINEGFPAVEKNWTQYVIVVIYTQFHASNFMSPTRINIAATAGGCSGISV